MIDEPHIGLLGRTMFETIRLECEQKWGAVLSAFDNDGGLVFGIYPPGVNQRTRSVICLHAHEGVRWGEVPFDLLPDGGMIWVVPVITNQRPSGAVVGYIGKEALFPNDDDNPAIDVHAAAQELLGLLEEENLTNVSLLELRRTSHMSERRRAEAIHAVKTHSLDFRNAYIREEPALMAAIRRGDREEARWLLNSILVVLHFQAGDNLGLVKSFFLEIVTLMCRTAVESGCDSMEILGNNYEAFTELSRITSDDELGPWLHDMLERLIDAIHSRRNDSPMAPQLQSAVAYMHDNLHLDISRDEVAAVAHLSPAHFSRVFKKEMLESFTDLLNRMRVDRAAELLANTPRSLAMIALDCGFKDQSYFTKVFRKYMRQTPRGYRLRLGSARGQGGKRT
ncbi:MAG: AraC family transcriptional regulator [Planctomycetes bacterium]|nr:AraC family transcriptional regulator [Planctomycetota bacterium]